MLVLSRKKDEVITIGDDIEILVVRISGSEVKLGITAPIDLAIHRKEVVDQRRSRTMAGVDPR